MNIHKFEGEPKDDDGVKNEQVVEICEFMIQKNWERIHHADIDDISFDEMKEILRTSDQAWTLATEVIEYSKMTEDEKLFRDDDEEEGV